MRIANLSVPKMAGAAVKCACGKTHSMSSEMIYCPYERAGEKLKELLVDYKLLYITDDPMKAGLSKSLGENVTTVVLGRGEDYSRLFAHSDGINCVAVYGGAEAVSAARYFATVRNIRSAALVSSADCAPLLKKTVAANVLGAKSIYPVNDFNFIFFDGRKIERTGLGDIYITLAAYALSAFEVRFAEVVLGKNPVCEQIYELLYDVFLRLCGISGDYNPVSSLFEQSFRLNYCLREGFPETESSYIMGELKPSEKYSAFEKLVDIYYIFFRYGKMRRYSAADYFSRMRAAAKIKKVSEMDISRGCYIPTAEELNAFSLRFEECRERFIAFSEDLKRRREQILNSYIYFGGIPARADVGIKIYTLPETSGAYGIISLMRDFGLLEKKNA